ncbi:MAG TPA: alpha-amylase family glycosyl hydrolase [Saprospiraceae bacterium]|nr:alpha-amylase family glycosyl hydrolase [Saprospiraceae bacterium]
MNQFFRNRSIVLVFLSLNFYFSGAQQSLPSEIPIPDWARSGVIYEVNLRQYTPEGTFSAFRKHLPRLKEMGVDVLWLMPIFPISKEKRKGTLGSYYSISSYTEVNPEFGTKDEFKILVKEIHRLGMKVILDWVPNHTGWDHNWIMEHPEWYLHDPVTDTIVHVEKTDWYDVADLDYNQKSMRISMIKAMLYWVDVLGVDGFRQDVAYLVPDQFWNQFLRTLISLKKELFLLAEAEVPEFRNASYFHADYAWTFKSLSWDIAAGIKNAKDFRVYHQLDQEKFKKGCHMYFTSNHDENSWNGTEFEKLGSAHQLFSALTFTFDGIPLIYSGQEEPLRRRLRFFEKDTIGFRNYQYASFYQKLAGIRKSHPVFWPDVPVIWSDNSNPGNVLSYTRKNNLEEALCIFNLSATEQEVSIQNIPSKTSYKDLMTGKKMKIASDKKIRLKPWEYIILIK